MSQTKPSLSVAESLLDSIVECYTAETVRKLADARLDTSARSRLEKLAAKANQGEITEEERQEYQSFIDYSDFLALLHMKARLHLGLPIAQS